MPPIYQINEFGTKRGSQEYPSQPAKHWIKKEESRTEATFPSALRLRGLLSVLSLLPIPTPAAIVPSLLGVVAAPAPLLLRLLRIPVVPGICIVVTPLWATVGIWGAVSAVPCASIHRRCGRRRSILLGWGWRWTQRVNPGCHRGCCACVNVEPADLSDMLPDSCSSWSHHAL